MRFWDSSALVPLIVSQPASSQADEWLAEDDEIVIWTLTPIELASAVMRLVREGALNDAQAHKCEGCVDELVQSCHVVIEAEAVKAQARRILRTHPLRAADALQMGAAWEWAQGRPAGRTFITLDDRLASAARREGFAVVPPPD